eukprot:CAMPEP_0172535058 /NCGR_PEP_ID=MMETSP1067-20121228/7225_1 /TAXON_ID=265564 ORGANISM="Thalassiosira punctigera, Strain Tpunct2005C2" /NCGR_SAMPLE_ID=MMETSP1067 /ASSEMBLY_ACC=CAM_ASM_000444 /LENGTH=196 /DNA_ID=CAMNT_0013319951 /DNA_START=30 /DNA_END=620 /DNA_ORIENTATION=-
MTKRPSNGGNGTVCHVLPCSIEEDITAPVAQYFHPTRLPADVMPRKKKKDGSDDDVANKNDEFVIMAAQFRGRGLLCTVDAPSSSAAADGTSEEGGPTEQAEPAATLSKLPPHVMGVVLSQSSAASPSTTAATNKDPPVQSLKVVETFQHVYNWSHEHDIGKVVRDRRGSDKHGLNAALGWCDLARAVHDSIPVPP